MSNSRIPIPTVGDQPFTPLTRLKPEERALYHQHITSVVNRGLLGTRNPQWNDELEFAISRELSFSTSPPSLNGNINERFSKRHPVADLNIPRDPVAIMQTALRYSLENPFVAKGLRVKTDFVCKDFRHQTMNQTVKDFYDSEAIRLSLSLRIREITWCLVSLGVAVVYWGGEDGGRINFLEVLDPRMTRIERIMGKDVVYLKIDQQMKDAVRDPQGLMDPRNKVRFQSLPAQWVKQIQENLLKGEAHMWILLEPDSYTVVSNRYTPFNFTSNSFSGGPLQPAFDALQRYRLISAGDFAVAWNVKNMITLISEGDPNQDVKTYAPSDDFRLANLEAKFSNPDYSLTVFCDPTTQVRYVVPPLEVFDPKKYFQVEKEIKELINLPSFMWNNDGGGTFGAAMAEIKMLRDEVDWLRVCLIEGFFRPLYSLLRSRAAKPGFAAKAIALPEFDKNSLLDDTVWLTTIGEAYGRGAASLGTYQEAMGLDPEFEMERLKQEHEKYNSNLSDRQNTTVAQPLYESNQGNQNPESDKGGRPEKPGSEPRPAQPRAPRTQGK